LVFFWLDFFLKAKHNCVSAKGGGARPPPPPHSPLFLDNTEARRVEKLFLVGNPPPPANVATPLYFFPS